MAFRDSEVYREEIERVIGDHMYAVSERKSPIDWDALRGCKILITGATGLIGGFLLSTLISANERGITDCKLIASARSTEKVHKLFGKDERSAEWVYGDVTEPIDIKGKVDYIIHAASPSSSNVFVEDPVGVIKANVLGTMGLLDLAKKKGCRGFLFLSTMEVYGAPDTDNLITEDRPARVDPSLARSCYPIGKILCENLCASYASQYKLPVSIARLAQTFGPGVQYGDGRVFAEFARAAIEGRKIVLKTKGKTKRSYISMADATRALLTILTRGDNNCGIYNVANEKTYCSIAEMAELVCGLGAAGIDYDLNADIRAYAPEMKMNLSCEKMKALGFESYMTLKEMFIILIEYMRSVQNDG